MSDVPSPATSRTLPRLGRPWLRQTIFAVVLLICGALIGGAATARFLWNRLLDGIQHPEQVPALVAHRMDRRLGLNDEQHTAILKILTHTQEQLVAVRRETYPKVSAILDETRTSVAAILSPEQSQKWESGFTQLRDTLLPPPPPAP